MTTGWGAPASAYEFTAALADGDSQAADAVWEALGDRDRAALLPVLGAQARLTAGYLPGITRHLQVLQLMDLVELLDGSRAGGQVREYAVAALRGEPCRAPRPGCPGLAAGLRDAAAAIAEIRLRTAAGLGFSRPAMAVICRRQARG